MNSKEFRTYRIMFYVNGCSHCKIVSKFIEQINMKLPMHKRIRLVECTFYQKYGVITDPLIALFSKSFNGFPSIFLDGIKMEGANTKEESMAYLNAFLEDDYIIGEYTESKFNKDCRFEKGIFKGVTCN
jgi:hypothetical protein